jgi:beta-RFAP synthase
MPSFEIQAPSRLHFGLLSFGDPSVRRFGGAGAMIDRPGLQLRISPADRFEVVGPLAERVRAVANRMAMIRDAPLPSCRVEVLAAPAEHVGLGTGTQLALSVVAGLVALETGETALEAFDWSDLVTAAGRAARSSIGTYGFALGGLIMEQGKLEGEALGPLEHRVDLPRQWRFVLVVPREKRGLSGEEERQAFDELPPVPTEVTETLRRELLDELFPAAACGEFARFSKSLYRYGCQAGMLFAARQGGAFASEAVAGLVRQIRALGVHGVGQSSWGPTVFALVENPQAADELATQIRSLVVGDDSIVIAAPNNSGARIAGTL